MPEPALTIRLLGRLDVRIRGKPLGRLPSRTTAWTLALLVLCHDRPVARDWLAGVLWPESATGRARYNLRRSLSELRRGLGPEAWRIATPHPRTVALDLSGADVDLLSFDTALHGDDTESLARAIALYGGPLLEDCAEEWVLPERQAREQAYLGALERLASDLLRHGDAASAVGHLRRAVSVEPLRESAHRLLLEALADRGDYAEAVQSYRALRLLLWQELNIEPSAEIRAAYERIRKRARQKGRRRTVPLAQDDRHPARAAGPSDPLPPVWSVPYRRNPNFIGREELLSGIEAALSAGGPAALTQAIVGLGGIGKTQCALEYAYRHADDHHIVWWVRAEEPSQLAADYAALAGPLDLPEKAAASQSVAVAAVRGWLECHGGWLLIFDNAPGPQALANYLPRSGGYVLITSRDQNWGNVATSIAVPVLPYAEAAAFLERRTGWPGPDVGVLAEELGCLPLALEQAAAYGAAAGCSVSTYLDLFHSHRQALLQRGAPAEAYRGTVATTWSLAMAKAAGECPAAAELLTLCAYLAPDGISMSIIQEGADHLPQPLSAAARDPLLLHDAVAGLRRYSLVEAREEALSVHRLVQAVVRDELSEQEQRQWAAAAVRVILAGFPEYPRSSYDTRIWPACALRLPHALVAAERAVELGTSPVEAGRLLARAEHYWRERYGKEDRVYLELAADFVERILGPDHPELSTRLADLAGEGWEGRLGGQALRERALAIAERSLGPNAPEVARRLLGVGGGLVWQERREGRVQRDDVGAKACFERALAIAERAQGPDGPLVGDALKALAEVLVALGDAEKAQACAERALTIAQRTYGPGDPVLADRHEELGWMLARRGDFAGQKALREQALAIREVRGPDDVGVAWALWDLAEAVLSLGELAEATACYERALAICEKVWGPKLPNAGGLLRGFARLLLDARNPEPAKAVLERANGPADMWASFDLLHLLGSVLLDSHDLEGAQHCLERALALATTSEEHVGAWVGPDYEGVVALLPDVGRLRRLQGRLGEAKACLEGSLTTPESLGFPFLGRMAATHLEYGLTLQAMGDPAGAREHLAQAVALSERHLGPRHPRTEEARRCLAALGRPPVT